MLEEHHSRNQERESQIQARERQNREQLLEAQEREFHNRADALIYRERRVHNQEIELQNQLRELQERVNRQEQGVIQESERRQNRPQEFVTSTPRTNRHQRNISNIWRMERTDSKVLPIEKFSGDPEEFADWVATYRMDAAACDWDEIDMIKRFPLHLTGFARTAYQQLSDDETITWTDLIENFRKKLSLSDNAQSSTQKFCARVQKPGERVIEFAFALRTLAQRAFSGDSGLLNEDLVEQLLFNQFITGLRHEIKTHAVMLNVYTFNEAVDKARILEERGLTDRKVAALNDEYSTRRYNYNDQREYERKRERSLSPVIASLLRDKIEKMNIKQQTEDDSGNLSKYYGSKSFDETYREPRMTMLDNENRGGYRSQRYNELNPRQGADDRYQKVSTQRDYNAEVRNQGGERFGGRDNRYEGGSNQNNYRDNYRNTNDYGNNRNNFRNNYRNTDDHGNNRNNFRNNDGYRNR